MTSSPVSGVLWDSDYIIALLIENETTHLRAVALRKKLVGIPQYILRPITYELATVVSRKFGQASAIGILMDIAQSKVGVLDIAEFEAEIWEIFRACRKNGTSFFDCANLFMAKYFNLKIASFDSFYPRNMLAA